MKKRILACIVCLCVILSIAPTIVFAEEERVTSINDNGFRVWSDDGKEFINRTSSTKGNVVVIDQAGTYNVTGSTTSYRIEIRITDETTVGTVTIVLNGTSIKPTVEGAAIGVAEECAEGTNVTIMLSEDSINEVLGYSNAGINNLGRELKIVGNGTLNATGSYGGAGIGGGKKGNGSNITITDKAKVIAKGKIGGAGIGGGMRGNGSNITISDNANVKADGNGGAGIGGGRDGNATNITISNHATVNANSHHFDNIHGGAGIGGGWHSNGLNISISGRAIVNATGGPYSAGIGGSWHSNGLNISISGSAKVTATGGTWGAGIGGGKEGNGENIEIFGSAIVNATGCNDAAGIGGGYEGNGENIEIFGSAIVNATGSNGAAGIGSGGAGNGSNITISGNPTIQVTSGEDGFGFGNSLGKSQITISGGTIKTLNCIPFSDVPDLINTNCDVLSNGKICENRRDDTYTSYADRFEIIPGA